MNYLYAYIVELAQCSYDVKHNDRSVLNDFEIDVLVPSKKLDLSLMAYIGIMMIISKITNII